MLQIIQPPGWPRPKGYSNGMMGSGQLLTVAGQVGWDENQRFHSELLYEQWDRALSNALAVVQAAGGRASDIILMIVIVTDLNEYRAQQTLLAVKAIVASIRAARTQIYESARSSERAHFLRLLGTADAIEGVTAFKEKRPPRFKGE